MIPGFENTMEQLATLTVRGDLISRRAAKEHFYMYVPGLAWDKIDAILDDIPSVQPERKAGKWTYEKEMQCSCCGFTCDDPYYLGAANYCPNCGAKMEGTE